MRPSSQTISKPLREAYRSFKDGNQWSLPPSQRAELSAVGINVDAVERYFRMGGNVEVLIGVLSGVNIYA